MARRPGRRSGMRHRSRRRWRRWGQRGKWLPAGWGCRAALDASVERRALHELVRKYRQRLVWLLHEHAGVLGALVDNDLNYDPSAAQTFRVGRSVNPVGLDETPLAARS